MKRLLTFLLMACVFCAAFDCDAARKRRRTSADVRTERTRKQRQLADARRQKSVNIRETSRQLDRLALLESEIRTQDARISVLQTRCDTLRARSLRLTDSIAATEKRVASLRRAYGASLRTMRNSRRGMTSAAFIFSAERFTEAYRRVRYLRELSDWQRVKAVQLRSAVARLDSSRTRLDSLSASLRLSLEELEANRAELAVRRGRAAATVDSLKRQARNIDRIVDERRRQMEQLDEELERVIEQEQREAAEAERRRREAEEARMRAEAERQRVEAERRRLDSIEAAEKARVPEKDKKKSKGKKKPVKKKADEKTKQAENRPQEQSRKREPATVPALSAEPFAQAKGKLPAPVSGRYAVTSLFGRNDHPDLPKVKIQNNGIDLSAEKGAEALAVYAGTVTSIFRIDGYRNIVILRHGDYLTVYAGLSDLHVRKGQNVAAGTPLGRIHSDPAAGDRTVLHFEIRHEREKLDPSEWLGQ